MSDATKEKPTRTMILTPMSTVQAKRQVFLWAGRIPMGTATIFAGRGGEGKSTFSLWLASALTRGFLDGEYKGIPSPVLLIGHEDSAETVVKPRLIAAEANMEMVISMTIGTTVEDLELREVPSLVEDLQRIRQAVLETGAKLIIVDPLTSTMGDANLDKTSDVRRALNPFMALANELDIAVIAIMHVRKGAGDTRDLLSGSHAFRDIARSVVLFVTDDETGQRIASVDKSNYSESRGDSFTFNLVSTDVDTGDGDKTTVARVEYLGESDISVNDIVNKPTEVNLGDDIGAVVMCVNGHPEGIKPAGVAEELRMPANAVRSNLGRAAQRGLIQKVGHGVYYPKATPLPVRTSVAPVAFVASSPEIATKASKATEQQTGAPVAFCSVCGLAMSPALAGASTHPGCDGSER